MKMNMIFFLFLGANIIASENTNSNTSNFLNLAYQEFSGIGCKRDTEGIHNTPPIHNQDDVGDNVSYDRVESLSERQQRETFLDVRCLSENSRRYLNHFLRYQLPHENSLMNNIKKTKEQVICELKNQLNDIANEIRDIDETIINKKLLVETRKK